MKKAAKIVLFAFAAVMMAGNVSAFGGKKKNELRHLLTEWYEKQSDISKQGLLGGRINAFMACIDNLNVYSDEDVSSKVAKAVTDIYIENWTDVTFDDFCEQT